MPAKPTKLIRWGLVLPLLALAAIAVSCSDDDVDSGRTPTAAGGAVFIISPDHGAPDEQILVSGCGFTPGSEVKITAKVLGSNPKATADASGRFEFSAVVPSIGGGTYVVRAESSDTVFAESVFVVEQQGGDPGRSPTPRPSPRAASC